jgi:hypothetical protein
MASSAPELACTSVELVYLAGLRGAQTIVGIDDPLRARTADDAEDALRSAQNALAARGFLALDADGGIVLDYDVARVIDAVAKPRRTLCAYRVRPVETGARRVFHVRGSLVVELAVALDDVRLVPLAGRAAVAEAVVDFWDVAEQPAVNGEAAILAQQALRIAVRLAAADGAASATDYLQAQGVGAGTAGPLATTLANPRQNAALLAYHVSKSPSVGMGLLEGINGLWRLRPMAGDAIEVAPCSGPELAELVRAVVTTVL